MGKLAITPPCHREPWKGVAIWFYENEIASLRSQWHQEIPDRVGNDMSWGLFLELFN